MDLLDWIWNTLVAPWPDLVVGQFELRDVANLVIGTLGALLAIYAFVFGRRQLRMQEREHGLWLQQQSKKLDLRLRASEQNRQWSNTDVGHGPVIITVRAKNGSEKTADGFYWEVLIPRPLRHTVKFLDLEGNEVPGRFHPLATDDVYDSLHGHYPHKLFGWSTVDVCKLSVNAAHPTTRRFWIKWRISCEDGGVPKAGGHAKIRYTRVDEGSFASYATYHPDPNGDQDVEPDTIIDQETETSTPVAGSGSASDADSISYR
jgi:hypothetical protein